MDIPRLASNADLPGGATSISAPTVSSTPCPQRTRLDFVAMAQDSCTTLQSERDTSLEDGLLARLLEEIEPDEVEVWVETSSDSDPSSNKRDRERDRSPGILPAHAHAASPEHSLQDLRGPPLAQPERVEESHSCILTKEDALSFSVVMPYKKDEFERIEQRFTAALAGAASTTADRVQVTSSVPYEPNTGAKGKDKKGKGNKGTSDSGDDAAALKSSPKKGSQEGDPRLPSQRDSRVKVEIKISADNADQVAELKKALKTGDTSQLKRNIGDKIKDQGLKRSLDVTQRCSVCMPKGCPSAPKGRKVTALEASVGHEGVR